MPLDKKYSMDFNEERELTLLIIAACRKALELFEREHSVDEHLQAVPPELRSYQESIGVGIKELEGKLQRRIGELHQ